MKKLGSIIYKKLYLQAQEAKIQGFDKLASTILNTIGSFPDDEDNEYAYDHLKDDIQQDVWKICAMVIKHYNIKSVDALKLDQFIEMMSSDLLEKIENELKVDPKKSLEPKTLGEE